MQLREDWKKAGQFISIRAAAAQAAFLVAWSQLPDDLKAFLPHWLGTVMALILVGLGVFGVLVIQEKKPDVQ